MLDKPPLVQLITVTILTPRHRSLVDGWKWDECTKMPSQRGGRRKARYDAPEQASFSMPAKWGRMWIR